MCGIAGYQGTFPPSLLKGMSALVAHRGPDGEGFAYLGERNSRSAVGLAHRRLAIIDLSPKGTQPMTVQCDRCGAHSLAELALTYNGEIYNYRDVRKELEARGHTFFSATDSEVLLHLFAEDGTEMLAKLNGIFAFAIRDGRSRLSSGDTAPGDLFIARDQLGVKPLYYAEAPSGFLFASELKALLACRELAREVDAVALQQYMAYLWTPAPRTMLRGVLKLRPGHALLVRDGRLVREWSYYDLPCGGAPFELSEEEAAEQLRERVRIAVQRQMVSDVPVGAFLSGGLDSSAIVAMMRATRPDYEPSCYCIAFADDDRVEGNPADLPYANRVARHLGVKLRTLTIEPKVINDLSRLIYYLDEPHADPAPINALLISEAARADGIKVLLSGAGGDDILAGYRRHRALLLERYWRWLPEAARSSVARLARASASGHAGSLARFPAVRRTTKALAYADYSFDERLISYFWWSPPAVRNPLLSQRTHAEAGEESVGAPLQRSLSRTPTDADQLSRMLYLECKHFLADHNLTYTDKMGMAAGVETRVPLLDVDLVAFAAGIPSRFKLHRGVGKALLKRALERDLPRDVLYRPKTGFGAPLRRWLRHELRPLVDDVLSPESIGKRGLFDARGVEQLVQLDRAGRIDGSYTIFAVLCLELWARAMLDGPEPSSDASRSTLCARPVTVST